MDEQGTYVDTEASLVEEDKFLKPASGDRYIGITLKNGARILDTEKVKASPFTNLEDLRKPLKETEPISELRFVPYCLQANRGGKGHMRVGLRRYVC